MERFGKLVKGLAKGGRPVDTRNPFHGNRGASKRWLKGRLLAEGVSEAVTAAVMKVPREEFVSPEDRQWAYEDASMAIGSGQTISQPSLVGRMIDALRISPEHTVLDVGTGSGYQAAALSLLARRVVSVERVPELAESARQRLARLGFSNIEVHAVGDELGWPAGAPYDGIIVGAAAPEVPQSLVEQLKVDGRLVIPVGAREHQEVLLAHRTEDGYEIKRLEPVRFVPLIGKGAWEG